MLTSADLLELSLAGAPLAEQRAALERALLERGISKASTEIVLRHVRDGVVLSTDLPPSRSRFGGAAKLPVGVPWPRLPGDGGWHLGFLMEIVLGDLPALDGLPSSGTLLVFADMEMFGLVHEDRLACFAVLYVPPGQPMETHAASEKVLWPLPAKALGARALPIPGDRDLVVRALADRDDRDAVISVMNELVEAPVGRARHWLLGAAMPVQNAIPDMIPYKLDELPVELRARYSEELLAGHGWRLLLQVGEEYDRDLGLDFGVGDGGNLYLCIPGEDLEILRFDRVLGFADSH